MTDARDTTMLPDGEDFLRRFSTHEIRESSEGRWLLQMKRKDGSWTGDRWMEVAALSGGKLLVHGDYDPVCFAYNSDSPESRVHWMARNYQNEPCSYVMEKASIGTGGRRRVTAFDREKAARDLRKFAAEYREDGRLSLAKKYKKAADGEWDTEERLLRELYDFDPDGDHDAMGRRPTWAVYAAWATLVRLSSLLKQADD